MSASNAVAAAGVAAEKVLRALQESSEQPLHDGDEMSGGDYAEVGDEEPIFDPLVFWSVNGFVLFLITCMALWCVFGNKDWLLNTEHRRQQTDEVYQANLRARIQEAEERKKETPEKRRKKLLHSFRKHKVIMTVTEDDLTIDTADTGSDPDIEQGASNDDADVNATPDDPDDVHQDHSFSSLNNTGILKLPNGRPPVPNCCAVCLGSYDIGETVIWSSNEKCAHAFHEECILEWLIKMQPETPCPCCRQEFTDLEAVRREKKIIWAGDAFSFSAVRL